MHMQRIVFLDRATLDASFRPLSFPHTWVDYDFTEPQETVLHLRNATIAITNKVPIREAELRELPELHLIAIAATGTDMIDLDACRARGVTVTNVRDYGASSVAEHVFALMLALSKNVIGWRDDVLAGEWSRSKIFCLTHRKVTSLAGATLGIVGYGSIAREVARIGAAFQMSVLIAERRGAELREGRVPFEQVLERADILTLHTPLSDETRGLIGDAELARMKPTAFLINTARGALIDEPALLRALVQRRIAGAALDVLESEPPRETPLLVKRDDLIVTPHVGWRSDAAQQALADQIVEAIEGFVSGRPFNVVP
jgi:glycerate dehydrogenase